MSSTKDSLNTLVQILSLKFPDDPPDIEMNDEFTLLVSPIIFPKITQFDLQTIQNNLQTAHNFTDALNGVNYYFPLVPIVLQLMVDMVDISSTNIEYCSYFTLCSYITWRLYVELTNNFENLPLLLDCFSFSSFSSQKKLIIEVYIQVVYFYLNSTAPFDFSYIFPTLSDFIISGRKEAIPVQCLFQPILSIFIPQQDSNVPEDCEELLRWFSNLPQKSYDLLTDETIKNILEKLFYHASLLHLPSVQVFSALAYKSPKELVASLCSVFPMALLRKVQEGESFVDIKSLKKTSIQLPSVNPNSTLSLHFVEQPTFEETMKTTLPYVFDPIKEIGKLIPRELKTLLECIAITITSFPGIQESIMPYFNSLLEKPENKENYSYEFAACIIYLVSIVNIDSDHTEEFIKSFLNSPVFSSDFSSFDAGPEFENLSRLRGEFITVLANRAFTGLIKLLDTSLETPLIFSEVFLRVLSQYNLIPMELLINRLLMRSISNASVIFSKIHVQLDKTKTIDKEVVETTRIALFNFIEKTLSIQQTANAWFSNPVFMNFFIALMFELPVRPFVIENLRKYIATKNEEFSSPLISSFVSTIEILLMHFPDEQHVILAMELLGMANSIIQHKKQLANLFSDLVTCVLDSISLLESNEIGHKFFIEVLEFINYESNITQLTAKNQQALKQAVKNLRLPQYIDQIKQKLMNIYINPEEEKNKVSNVLIYPILFEDYLINNCIDEWIQQTRNTLSRCLYNSLAFHLGEIDLFFLDFIEQHKNDKELNKIVVDVLELLLYICSRVASPIVVQKYINLLCPIEKKTVSIYFKMLITSLIKLVNLDQKMKKSFIPLIYKQPSLHLDTFPSHLLDNNGFQVNFSFFFEPFEFSHVILYELKDNFNNYITIYVENYKFYIKIEYNPSNQKHSPPHKQNLEQENQNDGQNEISKHKLSENSSVKQNDQENIIIINPLDKIEFKAGEIYNLSLTFNSQKEIEIKMNGNIVYQETNDLISNLGSTFSIIIGYTTEKHYQTFLYFCSFDVIDKTKNENICSINFGNENRSLMPQITSTIIDIRLVSSNPLEHVYNFIDLIINAFEVKSLFLIFYEMDYKDINGNKLQGIADLGVELLTSLFQSSQHVQQSFLDSRLTGILAHLLSIADISNLTYDLYNKIYLMMEQVVIDKLKSNMMKRILLELQIWCQSSNEVMYKITSYWLEELIPNKGTDFTSYLSVNSLLVALQKHKDDETEFGSKSMANLEQLILEISKYHFSSKNFLLFIGQCITCTKRKHIKLFLSIMKNILSQSHESPSKLQAIGNYISLLHNLLGYNDPDLFISLIEVIQLAHKNNMVKNLTLEQHITIIMCEMDRHLFSEEVIEKLLKIIKETKTNELLPMCTMIAINTSQKSIQMLIDNIDFENENYNGSKDLLWAVALFGFCSNENKKKILKNLYINKIGLIRTTCSMMNLLSVTMNIPESELIIPFMRYLIDYLANNFQTLQSENIQKLMFVLYLNVFYQLSSYQFQSFEEMFSVFSTFENNSQSLDLSNNSQNGIKQETTNLETDIQEENKYKPMTCKELYRKMEQILPTGLNLVFGLRMKKGKWIDEDVALKLVSLYEKILEPVLLQYDFLICCFLFRTQSEIVNEHIMKLRQKSLLSRISPSLVTFFAQIVNRSGKEFPGFPMPQDPGSALSGLHDIAASIPVENMPKQVAAKIIAAYENSYNIEKQFMKLINHGVAESALQSIDSFTTMSKVRRAHCKNLWKQLFNEMTQPKAYWELLIQFVDSETEKRWARDAISCYLSAPFKIKFSDLVDYSSELYEERRSSDDSSSLSQNTSSSQSNFIISSNSTLQTNSPTISGSSSSNSVSMTKSPSKKMNVCLVTINGDFRCTFEILENEFWIQKHFKERKLPYKQIQSVIYKKRNHTMPAVEIQTIFHKTYFIAFPETQNATFLQLFQTLHYKKIITFISYDLQMAALQQKTLQWVNGQISNFEYLMSINNASGRTFNSPAQYPFFPWILRDYSSNSINFNDPNSYRDLSLPICAQTDSAKNLLLQKQHERGFIFETAPISSQKVIFFLQRLEPFYTNWLESRSRNLFTSIKDLYEKCINGDEMTELIPEFFFFPEFLINLNHFDVLKDVELPAWTKDNSPLDFIYKNRKALESDYVSSNLHKWIDLNFGVKMKSVEDFNTFAPVLYETSIEHVVSLIERSGQLPTQLFHSLHPSKQINKNKNRKQIHSVEKEKTIRALQFNEHVITAYFDSYDTFARGTIALKSGKIVNIILKLSNNSLTVSNLSSLANLKYYYFNNNQAETIAIPSYSIFAAVAKENGKPTIVSNSQNFQVGNIDCIAVSDKWICCSVPDTGVFVIYKDSSHPIQFTIPTSSHETHCIAISTRFDLIVVGTSDGSLIYASLKKARVIKVINLKGIPIKVEISPSWGFVTVVTQQQKADSNNLNTAYSTLSLFNVNGSYIGTTTITGQITALSVFSSVSGFDYCAFATDFGEVFCFELYYLNIEKPLYRNQKDIISLSYLRESDNIIAATKSGSLVVFPICL